MSYFYRDFHDFVSRLNNVIPKESARNILIAVKNAEPYLSIAEKEDVRNIKDIGGLIDRAIKGRNVQVSSQTRANYISRYKRALNLFIKRDAFLKERAHYADGMMLFENRKKTADVPIPLSSGDIVTVKDLPIELLQEDIDKIIKFLSLYLKE